MIYISLIDFDLGIYPFKFNYYLFRFWFSTDLEMYKHSLRGKSTYWSKQAENMSVLNKYVVCGMLVSGTIRFVKLHGVCS